LRSLDRGIFDGSISVKNRGYGTRVVEHQSVEFENLSKTLCGTPVSWFWPKMGVPSDAEKGVPATFI